MESNKIFAAVLVAGILAMLSGFVAKKVIHVEAPEEDAYRIEAMAEGGAGGAAVEAVAEPILALLATADVEKGQNTGKACAACHTFNKGEPARVGPNLFNVVNGPHAHMEGFAYSDAMKAMHDKTWGYGELNTFLWNPKKHIPGTKMVFAGLKKPQDRANVIAWLRSLSDSPAALPSDSAIAAEAVAVEEEDAGEPVKQDGNAAEEAPKKEAKPTDKTDTVKPSDDDATSKETEKAKPESAPAASH